MKHLWKTCAIILSVALLLSLAACGSSKTASVPADLSGDWKQVNSASDTSYQVATISGDVIEIYWYDEEGETKALYWAGSFEAPPTGDEPYTWESVNDKSKTDTALLASGDDVKTFTYQNGQISYSVSAMGVTTTVKLEK